MTIEQDSNKKKWRNALKDLVLNVTASGCTINFLDKEGDHNNQAIIDEKNNKFTINILNKMSPRRKYYMLMHEFGHILLFRTPNYKEEFEFAKTQTSNIGLVQMIEEELAAWDFGRRFCISKNLPIDDYYFVIKSISVLSYIEFAVSEKKRKRDTNNVIKDKTVYEITKTNKSARRKTKR